MSSNTSSIYRYGKSFNTHDFIKVIAIIIMVIDHVGEYLLHDDPWFRMIGRIGLPMWYFLIGYVNKLRINYYLIGYGIILSITGYLFTNHLWIDVLLTFIFCQVLLEYCPVEKISTLWRWVAFSILLVVNAFIYKYVEYGVLGVFFVYSARMIAIKDSQASMWLIISMVVFYFWQLLAFYFLQNPPFLYLLAIMLLGVYYLLRYYTLKTLPCPKFLLWPLLVISRYSLHIYFYHLIALEMWAYFNTHRHSAAILYIQNLLGI